MEHLSPNAKLLIERPLEEKIFRIQSEKWIGYERANNILNKMEDLLTYPQNHRMPSLLIAGETNNGKTLLANRFYSKHKPFILPGEERLVAKVIYIQAPHIPDEKKFFNTLLDSLNAPYKLNDRIERKQIQALTILKRIETKVLIIDEIHNILAGSPAKQRIFLNMIKNLSNELRISIIAVGIRDAFYAINTDAQLANRFEPLRLPLWTFNSEYLRLLSSFEKVLPLKEPSNLIFTELALKILSLSEGTIGEISKIISLSAISALKTGKEKIDKNILEKIDYVPPSERKRISEN